VIFHLARDAFLVLTRDWRVACTDSMLSRTCFARDESSTSLRYVFVFVTIHTLQHRAVFDESFTLFHFEVLDEIFDQQSISIRYAVYFHMQCKKDFFFSYDLDRSNDFFDDKFWMQSCVDLL
jgi:hypothetical protein